MLRKCRRLLTFVLAIALMVTMFGSDYNSAKVFAEASDEQAVEEPAVQEPANDEPEVVEEPETEGVQEEGDDPIDVDAPGEEEQQEPSDEPAVVIPDEGTPLAIEPELKDIDTDKAVDGQDEAGLASLKIAEKVSEVGALEDKKVSENGTNFTVTYCANNDSNMTFTLSYTEDKLDNGSFTLPGYSDVFFGDDDGFIGWAYVEGGDIITTIENVENESQYTVIASWKSAESEEPSEPENQDGVKLTGEYDGVSVTVEAENTVLPINSELVVGGVGEIAEKITDYVTNNTEGEIEKIYLFDAAVFMNGNTKIQPNGAVNVTVNLTDGTSGKLKLFHFNDEALSDVNINEGSGTSVTISLNSLSPFALAVTPDEAAPELEEEKVDVDVFVVNATDEEIDKYTFEKLLGLEEENNGQYAVGTVSLSEEFIEAQDQDVDAVKSALADLSKESLDVNTKNTVGKNADKLTFDYSVISSENGDQLVLNITGIETRTVTYVARYYEKEDGDYAEVKVNERKYIVGDDVLASDSNVIFEPKKWYRTGFKTVNSIFTIDGEEINVYTGFTNIQEDKTVYAKYLPINLDGDTVDAYFFLLNRGGTLIVKEDDKGQHHQADKGYFPSGSGYWAGTAKNIDSEELADKITFTATDYSYKAIFDWDNGISKDVVGYEYKPGTAARIQNYLDSAYNAGIDADVEPITVDDIRWYIYKSERAAAVANHIDGYVTAYVTYDSNYFDTSDEDQIRVKDSKIKIDESTTVKENMFTSYPYEFLGWNTKRDGSGVSYSATDEIVVDKKVVLYAQWDAAKKYKLKIQVDAKGDQLDVEKMYSGIYFTNDLDVTVTAESVTFEGGNGGSFRQAVANFVHRVLSLGTLVVYAADEDLTNKKYVVDENGDWPKETVDGLDVAVKGLYTTGGKGIDVGNYPVNLNYDEFEITTEIGGKEVDIKDLFEVEVEIKNGSQTTSVAITDAETKPATQIANLKIVKRNVTLRSRSASKQYDGTPLTNGNVDVSGDGFANGIRGQEGATYNVTGSQTAVGSSPNTFPSYTLLSNTDANNYNITKAEGTLTVTSVPGDNPPPTDPPVITPPSGQVLGATREVDGAAVLGARRGRTEDTTNTLGRVVTIIIAAGIGFTMIFIKRKKSEEE